MPSNGFKRDKDGKLVTLYLILDHGRECSRCDTFKTWDQYHRKENGAYGRDAVCKTCRRQNIKPKPKYQIEQQEPMAQSMTGGFKLFLVDRVHLNNGAEK